MKLCLLAIGFVLLLSIDEGESWPSCRVVTALKCSWSGCHFRTRTVCSTGRKKRSTEEGAKSESVWVPLPCKFSTWDTDKDGSISLAEFAFAGHTKKNGSNTGKMFKRVDKDGNKKISKEEFDVAPLLLEKC